MSFFRRAVPLMTLVAIAATPAIAPAAPTAPRSSKGMTLVAQIPGPGGTDLEFLSRRLSSYRDARGRMVKAKRPTLRHFAVVGNQKSNTKIIDITNPEKPYLAAEIPCTLSQGDVQVNAARNLVVIANGTGSAAGGCEYFDAVERQMKPMPPGGAIVDISNLYAPKVVGAAPTASGAHNVTLHPSGRYLYISTSEIVEGDGRVPIYDLTDLRRPKLVATFSTPGNAPHDVRFNPAGTRAYLAGISQYRIIDTANPVAPKLVSVFYPPGNSIGHDTLVTPDGAYLFAGDEGGGGGTYPCPGGAVHVFDIRKEATPVYLGQSYAGVGPVTNRDAEPTTEVGATTSCTSHVMELNPDKLSLTIAWYGGGSRVFRFDDLYSDGTTANPGPSVAYGHDGVGLVESNWIAPEGASTWSAKQYAPVPGYIFSDDLKLGFYVTRLPRG